MGENHQHLVDQHTTQTQVEDKSRYATTTTTTLHQSKHKYKYTMKITGLISSTLMLLLVVMTSTASALSIERPPSCEFETRLGDSILVEELMHVTLKTISAAGLDNWSTSQSAIRTHQSLAAELSLWNVKLVSRCNRGGILQKEPSPSSLPSEA